MPLRLVLRGALLVFAALMLPFAFWLLRAQQTVVEPWMEIPQSSTRIPGNHSLLLTGAPRAVEQIVIHMPGSNSHVNYGMIHTKVNTEAADVGMKSISSVDDLALHIDLTAAGGFFFRPGRNSVELEYEDRFGRSKYFNFVLDFQPSSGSRGFPITPPPAASTPPRHQPGHLLAVVIGISQYLDQPGHINNLRFADKDAESVAQFLRSRAGGAVADEDLLLLLNQQATVQNIRHALFTFLASAQPDDIVFIYIAGHGAPDPHDPRNLYLLAADSRIDDMGATAFPMWQMQDVFARILHAHRVITVVDTCHSYGFTGNRAGDNPDHGNNLFNQYLQRYASVSQHAVLTASDISENSLEDEKWGGGHGVFTWYLLRGLQGEADRNHDGIVTAGELFAYVQQAVRDATGGSQNPRAMYGIDTSLIVATRSSEHASIRSSSPPLVDWSAM